LLNINGLLILSAAGMSEMVQGLLTSITCSRQVLTGVISHSAEDMIFLKELIENGELKPVIDKTYSFAQIAEAHAYVEKGHESGSVAVSLEKNLDYIFIKP
jgi:NADPH:quinone reductase-like Zn-dependent oxidoreductase